MKTFLDESVFYRKNKDAQTQSLEFLDPKWLGSAESNSSKFLRDDLRSHSAALQRAGEVLLDE